MKISFGLFAACLGLFMAMTQVDFASAQTTTKRSTTAGTTNKGSGESGRLKQFEDLATRSEKRATTVKSSKSNTSDRMGGGGAGKGSTGHKSSKSEGAPTKQKGHGTIDPLTDGLLMRR